MSVEPPTQLIAAGELRVLVEASLEDTQFAHVIRRPRASQTQMPRARMRNPSAVRGLLWLAALAIATRELVMLFY